MKEIIFQNFYQEFAFYTWSIPILILLLMIRALFIKLLHLGTYVD